MTEPTEWREGQQGYTAWGQWVFYKGLMADGRYLVAPVLTVTDPAMSPHDGDGYEHEEEGPAFIVERLLRAAPVEKKALEIIDLDAQIGAKKIELRDLQTIIHEATSEHTDLLKRLADVPALRYLDDFIAGRMTHVVTEKHGYTVQTTAAFEADKSDDAYIGLRQKAHPWKLLTLFGKSGGDLQWQLSKYRAGGGEYSVWLFMSEGAAKAFAIQKTGEKFTEQMATIAKGGHTWNLDAIIRDALVLGMEIPADIVAHCSRVSVQAADKAVEKARAELDLALVRRGELVQPPADTDPSQPAP